MVVQYRLRSWVDLEKINWRELSANPCPEAVAMLASNPDKIDWMRLSSNPCPYAVALLAANVENVDWKRLSINPCPDAVALLRTNPYMIDWNNIQLNPCPDAVRILAKTPRHLLNSYSLSQNTNPDAIKLLKNYNWRDDIFQLSHNTCTEALDLVASVMFCDPFCTDNIYYLSGLFSNSNPEALRIIRRLPPIHQEINRRAAFDLAVNTLPEAIELLIAHAHPDNIDWFALSENPCPAAIALLVANPHKIYWHGLVKNTCPVAMDILAANLDILDNLCWSLLSSNPSMFEEMYDYPAMRAAMDLHREALACAACHPRRLARHLELGGESDDF